MPTKELDAEPLDTSVLLRVLTAFDKGDFSARMPSDWTGIPGKIE
jgi:hypothetical protein